MAIDDCVWIGPDGWDDSEPPWTCLSLILGRRRVCVLVDHSAVIEAMWEPHRVADPLREVLFLAVCGTIMDCDDDAITWWGKEYLGVDAGLGSAIVPIGAIACNSTVAKAV